MSLDSKEHVYILLPGPLASAKTMLLEALMKLNSSYFIDGDNTTRAGVIDYIYTLITCSTELFTGAC
jgi:hypothetical protein